jgi:shikimate dehydrogenase
MKRAGVIGWPVAHSLSPLLHGHWLQQYGIDGTYEKIPAAPEDFAATIARLRRQGYAGVNVTVPHKEAAFALADDNDGPARMTGATNLLVFGEDGVMGHNTDFYGLMESLRENIGALTGKTVILLGAGGAARGAVLALEMLGAATIHLLNRDPRRAESLAAALCREMPHTEILPGALADWNEFAFDAALVVNSTSAGMGSNPPLALDLALLLPDTVVCDIVYHPLETQLLQDAAARGLATIDGLGMLMHQAVPSFEAFFGIRPEVTPGLRDVLERELKFRG